MSFRRLAMFVVGCALAAPLAGAGGAGDRSLPLMVAQAGLQGIFDPGGTTIQTQRPAPITNLPAIPGVPGQAPIQGFSGPSAPGLQPGLTQPGQQPFQIQSPFMEGRDRNDFQDFIFETTGRELPIFGAELFRNVPSTFAPVENIPVMADYVIGPSDEILIRAWGQIDVDFRTIVDRNGTINVPRVGVINVSGIKYQDLDGYLKTIFARVFRNFELTASLGVLRSIQIYVVGQARRPGTYTVSSLSTLVNAIFAAGGPTTKGSMRSVQLKRANQTITDLDLYDLLLFGDKSKDARLQSGDVIYFPAVGPLVAVVGSVNVPAVYELKRQVPLSELIAWAGGLATPAQGQRVSVERIQDRKARKVEELTLDAAGLGRPLQGGDLVMVYAITPRFDQTVTLRGNVAQPARYPWREGMRVRDLIPEKEALLGREYWTRRNQLVFPLSPEQARFVGEQLRFSLQDQIRMRLEQTRTVAETPREQRTTPPPDRLAPTPTTGVTTADVLRAQDPRIQDPKLQLDTARRTAVQALVPGAAVAGPTALAAMNERPDYGRFAGEFPLPRSLTELGRTLGEVYWDYAVIERINPNDLTTMLLPFNLGKAVLEKDEQHNLLLQPRDVITVFSKDDLRIPQERQSNFVHLEGEINHSGVYKAQPGETLRQLVARAGGISPYAYLFGAEFTRESTRKEQQKRLDEALTRLEQDVQRAAATRAASVISVEDASALAQQAESQRQLIARLRQLRPSGRIVLELPEQATLKDLPDLPLEDGDRFVVPPRPSMVNVFGSVYGEAAFLHKPEKRVGDYLAQAGGITQVADKSSIYVLRADGTVISRRQSGFLAGLGGGLEGHPLMPGDTIVVPEEFDRTTWTRTIKDYAQIFYQLGLGVAALKVLRD
jgi:protein involved in polysaccharide export with SLBB domain